MKKCFACAEEIQVDAKLCRFCKTIQAEAGSDEYSLISATLVPEKANLRRSINKKAIVISALILIVIFGIGTAYSLEQERVRLVEVAAQESAAAKAAEEAQAEAEAQKRAEEAARAAEEAERVAEMALRNDSVVQIEDSIAEMAKDHIRKGLIRGKVLEVNCSPTSGYSLDDLTDTTTEFLCFAATKDNGDGTRSGYYYDAIMDWNAGSYSYGLAE